MKALKTQPPTSQWMECSAWQPGPASGREVLVRSQGIISRAVRDTVSLFRHEPPDRFRSERPRSNGQLLLAAPQRIMMNAFGRPRTLGAAAPRRWRAAAELQSR